MKPLELNKEQKDKLLEMCTALFPGWTIYKIKHDNIISGNQWETDEEDSQESIPINEFNIHWFEFCMTHLVKSLCEVTSYEELITAWLNGSHPVDFLYKEFKKLK